MAAANAPITITEALTLPSIGIDPQFFLFTNITMESDKYICVRETSPQNRVVIIDMSMPMQPLRKPITAESVLMNPNSRIMALKAQIPGTAMDFMQIANIEHKAMMKSYNMPEQVVFWKWINAKMLGLVTHNSVYHWSIEGGSGPVMMFQRTANLANNQIINYRCDPSEKWLLLVGLAPGSPEMPKLVKGNMQLFSVDKQRSQTFEAHAASFASFKVPGNEKPSILISFATKMLNAGQITSKLHVIELGAQPGKPSFRKKEADLFVPPGFADDFPIAIQISHKYSLIYVITKLGLLLVYDLETATAVYCNRISTDPIFLTCEASSVGGFYAVNRRGQVLLATVNKATTVPFLSGRLKHMELDNNLAKRRNLPGDAGNLFSLAEIEDATNFFEKVLGHGGEGTVYLGHISAIGKVAVKRLKSNLIEFEEEIEIVSKIKHPNLVSLHGYCDESSQKILVYEYMGKGSLSDYVRNKSRSTLILSWQQRLNICLGAARGLQHLHKETDELPKGIIHRDIKPDNILLDDNWVAKISDFGLCKLSHAGQKMSTMITVLKGTGGYYAPEYVKYGSITRKLDVYAFGVVLFEILCRKTPWDRGDESYYRLEDEDLGLWARENVDPEINDEISEDCLEAFTHIIGRCLQLNPSLRPTMDEVVMDLECALKCQDRQDEGTSPKASTSRRKVSIPGSVQKTILNIKEMNINEITEYSEEEIYKMLKECSMDPFRTIQKLLTIARKSNDITEELQESDNIIVSNEATEELPVSNN